MKASDRIRAAFATSDWTVNALAKESGYDAGNLSRFLRGASGINLENGVVLARALGVDLFADDDVATGEEWSKKLDEMLTEKGVAKLPEVRPRGSTPSPPPSKRPMSPAEIRKRKSLGMPID